MASFQVISERQAPARPRPRNGGEARMRLYEGYVSAVKKGQAGRLILSPGETARSVAVRVRRAARRLGQAVEVWSVDETVYFRSA